MNDHFAALGRISALLDNLADALEVREEARKQYREDLENIEKNLKPLF